jgi:hypothetical protein
MTAGVHPAGRGFDERLGCDAVICPGPGDGARVVVGRGTAIVVDLKNSAMSSCIPFGEDQTRSCGLKLLGGQPCVSYPAPSIVIRQQAIRDQTRPPFG